MGNRQSKKEKQDKHAINKDTKEAAVKKETDQSSFAKLPSPTSPDDLNLGKSKDLTGNLNNTATTSQGLGPTKLNSHSVEPSNGKEAIFTRIDQVPAGDVPQKREQSILTTGNISQDADLVKSIPYRARVTQQQICPPKPEDPKTNIPKPRLQQATPARPAVGPHHGVKTSAGDYNALRSDILQQLKDAPETLSQQQSTSTAPMQQQKITTAEVPTSTPTEPPHHSTQMSNEQKTQVNNEENALQEPGLNHNNVTNISVNYQYCFRAKSETSRANVVKMRLRQKLAKKLKAHPQDGSKSSQQTVEETVTVQESSQQQGCTAMRAKKHKKPHRILQPNKADYDTNGNPLSSIQKVNVKAPEPQVPVFEQKAVAAPNITATHHPTTATAAADANVKLRLQCQLKVSLPQDTAVKPKKKCTFIALNQNQPKGNAGNVAMEEKLNGNNGNVGKERPEPAFIPAPNPEHKVHAEGRWHPFTVNQSCSFKAQCHHNPGTGLPPNIQKWIDECPNYLCESPWVTPKLTACLAQREAQEEGGDSHQ